MQVIKKPENATNVVEYEMLKKMLSEYEGKG